MFRYLSPRLCLLALCLAGCSGSAPNRVAEPGVPAAASTVSMEVLAQPGGSDEWQPLSQEDVLHSGDRYRVAVRSTQPLFLYLIRGGADRSPEFLVPKDQTAPLKLAANAQADLPAQGQQFQLDNQIGEESLYLVATDQPLAPDKVKEVMASAPAGELGKGRGERPEGMGSNNRGGKQPAAAAPAYVAKPISPGIYGLRFTFQHQQ